MTAALAEPPYHFLIGQYRPKLGTPVDGNLRFISQPMIVDILVPFGITQSVRYRQLLDRLGFLLSIIEIAVEELEEYPLGPFEVPRIGGRDFAIPIVAETQRLGLPAHIVNVLASRFLGRRAGLNCILLGGQTERVPAERMQDVEASHPLVSGDYVACRITFRVAHMQSLAARVGKHVQHIILRPGIVAVPGLERFGFFPEPLPLLFNFTEFIKSHHRTHL